MRAALYLRYSSDRQTEQSIEGQFRVCSEFCEKENHEIVAQYIDRATSASKDTDKRTQFLKMIKDSEKKTFDCVIVYKLDRFSRNRYDSANYKSKLKKNGVRLISATEPISDSPEGIILESMLEGMAEYYSAELSQKVTRGLNESAHKCQCIGGTIPLGYKVENKKFVIDEPKAKIVREIFSRYASGETTGQIAEDLNNRGIRTSQGNEWGKNSFHSLLLNEKYIGVYNHRNIRVEGGVPAIVDKTTFDEVQRKMQINRSAPAKGKATTNYLLSTKLFCGHCRKPMVGDCGTSKAGNRVYYYTCSTKKRQRACDKKSIRKEVIEKAVVQDVMEVLNNDETIDLIADMAVKAMDADIENNTIIPAKEAEIRGIERKINNLMKTFEEGIISQTCVQKVADYEKLLEKLRAELEREKASVVSIDKPLVVWWLKKFYRGDIEDEEYMSRVIDLLVNSVTVWDMPDGGWKVTILLNISQNKEPHSFVISNGQGSDLDCSIAPQQNNPNIFVTSKVIGFTKIHHR